VLSDIVEMLSEARRRRPRLAQFADRAAAWFIALILVSTALAAGYWWQVDSSRVIPVVLSMLVVACPCALALGTPTALASATRGLAIDGVLTANPDALERLARVTHVVLDKTGTLTRPGMQVVDVQAPDDRSVDELLAVAAALERVSTHPVASAFSDRDQGLDVESPASSAGAGVSGRVNGRHWWLGRPDWVAEHTEAVIEAPETGIWLALVDDSDSPPAWIRVEAPLRDGVDALLEALRGRGLEVVLASGDRAANVDALADELGIETRLAGQTPGDKLELVETLRSTGATVAMVGDGINDAPVLAGADVSIALAEGAAIARTQADLVIGGDHLGPLARLFNRAPRVRRVIGQNLIWALSYNLSALPLAAAGWVPPWAAAIGMSASSLIVVLNARRLGSSVGSTRRTLPGAPQRAALAGA